MKTLREILADLPVLEARGSLDVPVRGIKEDSRKVEPGDLFVCLPGYRKPGGETRADRHEFVPEALARGASAFVVERDLPLPETVTVVRVAHAWRAIAELSCRFYDHPSRELLVVGITGTSGKTSTAYYVEGILLASGKPTARIGTVEYKLPLETRAAPQTTPEAPELQALLREARQQGGRAAVMEVSSHALALHRVDGIEFDAAVFTNLSQDHLNFHESMEEYLSAKLRLFELLGRGLAVLHADDPASAAVRKAARRATVLTYGRGTTCDVRAEDVRLGGRGLVFSARTPVGTAEVELRSVADFSVENALGALATGIGLGLPLEVAVRGLETTPQVPGRFEVVDPGADFLVVVDYAHKPAALETVLRTARKLASGRVLCVFGCGGDRDRSKRPQMGRVAARLADLVVVTSDNPRTEDPEAIIGEILTGIPGDALPRTLVEPDRRRAIERAVELARPGDVVLVAGKGHETYQIVGSRRLPFDDREVAREALARLRKIPKKLTR
ncbi:MAG: UDP-N-acetylmuramoyl-L-alanyl-D-glutamate--2,6-diaminopimelate ligase [Candidatus Binatia bacterium]|nr:MAG: UDP-N-acetylmuramoyl-L-alanyl-D-glutamate--2,6-diaminopimelate ligase [Candidatus Binatia bacterium]